MCEHREKLYTHVSFACLHERGSVGRKPFPRYSGHSVVMATVSNGFNESISSCYVCVLKSIFFHFEGSLNISDARSDLSPQPPSPSPESLWDLFDCVADSNKTRNFPPNSRPPVLNRSLRMRLDEIIYLIYRERQHCDWTATISMFVPLRHAVISRLVKVILSNRLELFM